MKNQFSDEMVVVMFNAMLTEKGYDPLSADRFTDILRYIREKSSCDYDDYHFASDFVDGIHNQFTRLCEQVLADFLIRWTHNDRMRLSVALMDLFADCGIYVAKKPQFFYHDKKGNYITHKTHDSL